MTPDAIPAPGWRLAIRPQAMAQRRGRRLGRGVLGHGVLLALSFVCLFPIYWMVVTSLRPANAIFETTLWPSAASLANYRYTLNAIPVAQMLGNTLVVALLVTAIQLLTALLAAFAFARWRFTGDRLVFALVALTWLVPFQVVMIPNFLLVAQLGLLDSLTALVLPHFASALAVMLLTQAIRAFPQEVIEACFKTATDLYGQLGADNPRFKKIADSYMAFRSDQYLWWQVAEYSFDNFMIRQRRAKT